MQGTIWGFNSASSDPVRQSCVKEWQSWLDGVQMNRERIRLEKELRSAEDHKHFSSRLELFFHHHFRLQGCRIDFHPRLEASVERPDLLIHHHSGRFYLEATIRHEERWLIEQQTFADLLRTEMGSISSSHVVTIHIQEPCPEKGLLGEIRTFLEEKLEEFDKSEEGEKELVWKKSVAHKSYMLHLSLLRRAGGEKRLTILPITGGWAKTDKVLYDTIHRKARRYGSLNAPFVVVVWGLGYPEIYDELNALYGADVYTFHRDSHGNFVQGSDRQQRQPDGVFTSIEDGQPRNRKVSAVVFYQHRLGMEHPHVLRIYHNPYAESPLSLEVFLGFPQLVPIRLDGQLGMKWSGLLSDESE